MKIEQTPQGMIEITYAQSTFLLSRGQGWELLEWLYEHQDWLRGKDDEPGEEEQMHLTMQERMHKTMESIGIVPAPARADKENASMNSSDLKATLLIGDEVQYRCANPADSSEPVQVPWKGPYTSIVVGLNTYTVEVRRDGWGGSAPLYRPFYNDILQVNGHEPVGDGGGPEHG